VVAAVGLVHLRTLWRALDSPSWPQVTGSVLHAGVLRGCGRQRNSYEPDIGYLYSVNGFEYRSQRVEFGRGYCGSEAGARDMAKAYVPGTAVTVYVDPADPARAVLLAGKTDWLMYVSALLTLLAALAILILPWRAWRGQLKVSW